MRVSVITALVLIIIFTIPIIHAYEEEGDKDAMIFVEIVKEPIIDLASSNRLIRASVDIINFDPAGDGNYFMQVINSETDKITRDELILISQRDGEVWGSEIGTMIDDTYTVGDYEILIYTEFGNSTGNANFSIINSSESIPNTNDES